MLTWPAEVPSGGEFTLEGHRYRVCRNGLEHGVCNWCVRVDEGQSLCRSCRATPVIPDLSVTHNLTRWHRLETAKRRLLIGLLSSGLLRLGHGQALDPPLRFEFPGASATTGHADGTITVDIDEADDDERERRRVQFSEPYRTLVGHLRHEVGHFYWDQAVKSAPRRLAAFRLAFGDERSDYTQALDAYYRDGPAADWPGRCVSAYASAHPWEDWAETFAHYLHMVDSLETAFESGLWVRPRRRSEPSFEPAAGASRQGGEPFVRMLERWMSLTYVLNDLTRGLGLADAYPFVLSTPAIRKLRFVHDTLGAYRRRTSRD